jgi:ABC-type enterobactin transport system permease subunit
MGVLGSSAGSCSGVVVGILMLGQDWKAERMLATLSAVGTSELVGVVAANTTR